MKLIHKISFPREFTPTSLLAVYDQMWVGTRCGYVFLYDAHLHTLLRNVKLADTQIRVMVSVFLPTKTTIWVVSDGDLIILNPSAVVLKSQYLLSSSSSLILAAGDCIFTACALSISLFDSQTEQLRLTTTFTSPFSFSPNITCFGFYGEKIIGFINSDLIIQTFHLDSFSLSNVSSSTS